MSRPPAKRGEVIEIRTLAGHDMETGFRRTQTGELVPRDIITNSPAPTTARRSSAPTCIRRSRPIPDRLHTDRHGERHAGVPLERRPRLRRLAERLDYSRVIFRLLVFIFFTNTTATAEIPLAERRSGYEFMSRETRAMQDDEATGPRRSGSWTAKRSGNARRGARTRLALNAIRA
jgi:hypothetical protein